MMLMIIRFIYNSLITTRVRSSSMVIIFGPIAHYRFFYRTVKKTDIVLPRSILPSLPLSGQIPHFSHKPESSAHLNLGTNFAHTLVKDETNKNTDIASNGDKGGWK